MPTVVVILLIVAFIVFLASRKKRVNRNPSVSNLRQQFTFKTVREIRGIDLIPFHINNLEKAFARGDLKIVNLSYAKIIEIVRQKNVDEKGEHEEILKSLRNEYEQFRQSHGLEYPQQFLPPTQKKTKISNSSALVYLEPPSYDELPKSMIENVDVVRTVEQWNQLGFKPKKDEFGQWNEIKRGEYYFTFKEVEHPKQREKLSLESGKKITESPYCIRALMEQGCALDDFVDNLDDLPLFFAAEEKAIYKKDYAPALELIQRAIQKRPLEEYKKLKEFIEIKLGNIDIAERKFREYEFDIDSAVHGGEIFNWLNAFLKNKKYDSVKKYIQKTNATLDDLAKGKIKAKIYGEQNSDWYAYKKEDFHKHLDKMFDSDLPQLEKSDDAISLLELYLSLYTGKDIKTLEQIATLYSSWDLKEKSIRLYNQCLDKLVNEEKPKVKARINKKLAELTA